MQRRTKPKKRIPVTMQWPWKGTDEQGGWAICCASSGRILHRCKTRKEASTLSFNSNYAFSNYKPKGNPKRTIWVYKPKQYREMVKHRYCG